MNSNLFHNIANGLAMLLAVGTAALVATGCVEAPDGGISCEASFLDPKVTTIGIAVLMGAKLVVNVIRDGLTGLTKPQPPVPRE